MRPGKFDSSGLREHEPRALGTLECRVKGLGSRV